ncbi:hypothetical protein WK53_07920 [Burkholderia ubonensis]|uniref:Integrase catalytic domain-containing protein n=1 Tax=Burkholderia ubonensis TaxID=101571 RepID=A0AAW3NBJ3_9BURK|nr:hypothetical protein WK53_07920 [Burkholderia ubonensis]
MSECAAMHRHIKGVLTENGIKLTPLMPIQVPNGGAALDKAREYLTGPLKFPESAVKVHVSEEPAPNLQALAQDPTVEVLVFKMAVVDGVSSAAQARRSRAGGSLRDAAGQADAGRLHRHSPGPRAAVGVGGDAWLQPCELRAFHRQRGCDARCAGAFAKRSSTSVGTPEQVLFDNAKSVIVERDAFGDVQHRWNTQLLALVETYGFSVTALDAVVGIRIPVMEG